MSSGKTHASLWVGILLIYLNGTKWGISCCFLFWSPIKDGLLYMQSEALGPGLHRCTCHIPPPVPPAWTPGGLRFLLHRWCGSEHLRTPSLTDPVKISPGWLIGSIIAGGPGLNWIQSCWWPSRVAVQATHLWVRQELHLFPHTHLIKASYPPFYFFLL